MRSFIMNIGNYFYFNDSASSIFLKMHLGKKTKSRDYGAPSEFK